MTGLGVVTTDQQVLQDARRLVRLLREQLHEARRVARPRGLRLAVRRGQRQRLRALGQEAVQLADAGALRPVVRRDHLGLVVEQWRGGFLLFHRGGLQQLHQHRLVGRLDDGLRFPVGNNSFITSIASNEQAGTHDCGKTGNESKSKSRNNSSVLKSGKSSLMGMYGALLFISSSSSLKHFKST